MNGCQECNLSPRSLKQEGHKFELNLGNLLLNKTVSKFKKKKGLGVVVHA